MKSSIRSCACVFTVAVTAALLTCWPVQAAQAADLQWKLVAGQELTYEMRSDTLSTTSVMGQNLEMVHSQHYVWTFRVVEVTEDGTGLLQGHFDRVAIEFDGGQLGTFSYDSDEDGDMDARARMMLGPYKALAGAEFEFRLDKLGRVSDLTGVTEAIEAAHLPKSAGPMGNMSAGLSNEMFEKLIGEPFSYIPDHGVDTGDSWDKSESMTDASGTAVRSHVTYTLDALDGEYEGQPCADVSISGEFELDMDADAMSGLPDAKISMDKGKGRGHAYFDRQAGRHVRYQKEDRMEMTITLGGGSMTSRSSTRSRTTFTLLPEGSGSQEPRGPETGTDH